MTPWVFTVAAAASGLIVLGWIIYPGILSLLGSVAAKRASVTSPQEDPKVAVVIATRDDPDTLVTRVQNIRGSTYPGALIRVIVSVDARAASHLDAYRAALGQSATIVQGDLPGGKAAALNAGVREASEALIVFADSKQSFDSVAIENLVREFDDAMVGGVTGGYRRPAESSFVLRVFWRYETWLRRQESRLHSVVAVTGCIYAIRRKLWRPLPDGAICDDLFVPANVIFQDHRVTLCEKAFAVDDRTFTRAEERTRKVRTLTGMLQFCLWEPRAVVPVANPVFFQFLCHKLIRLATPLLALVTAVALAWGVRPWLPMIVLTGLGLVLVVVVLLVSTGRRKIIGELAWAGTLFLTPLSAVWNALRGRWEVWQPNQPTPDQPEHVAAQVTRP